MKLVMGALSVAVAVSAFPEDKRASASHGFGPSATGNTSKQEPQTAMKIRIEMAGTNLSATLDDSRTARDFASLLPLSLSLEDYAATEKISQLPRRLSTEGAPDAITPKAGDIAYYAPWGNLAIFHKDFDHSPGLVRLGRLDSGVDAMRQRGPLQVTIRRAGP